MVEIPVVNVSCQDAWLHPHTPLGALHVVELRPNACSVTIEGGESSGRVAVVHTVKASRPASTDLSTLTWPNLLPDQEQNGRDLLEKYRLFSQDEGDLGCATLVQHEISLLDDIPVKQ